MFCKVTEGVFLWESSGLPPTTYTNWIHGYTYAYGNTETKDCIKTINTWGPRYWDPDDCTASHYALCQKGK